MRLLCALMGLSLLSGCGGVSTELSDNVVTQADPYVARVAPTTAGVGASVQLFGFGFSLVPEENMIILGSTAAVASAYTINPSGVSNEIETLSFTVPANAPAGLTAVVVSVFDSASNSDVTLTITP